MSTGSHSRAHDRSAWIVSILLAVIFVPMGLAKLAALPLVQEPFVGWGYAVWSLYLIGFVEVVAGIALLVPRITTYAAGVLVVEMLLLLVTVVAQGQAALGLLPIALGAAAMYLMWARIPDAAGTDVDTPLRT